VIRRERVTDGETGVMADDGVARVVQRFHQRDELRGERGAVVAAGRLVGQAHSALVDGDYRKILREGRHQVPPRVPRLRPAVHEQHCRAATAGDSMEPDSGDVDVAAGENVRESSGQVRRLGDGSQTSRLRCRCGVHQSPPGVVEALRVMAQAAITAGFNATAY
jgi:hypothetical protein